MLVKTNIIIIVFSVRFGMTLDFFINQGSGAYRRKIVLVDKPPDKPIYVIKEDEYVWLELLSSEPLPKVILWVQDLALIETESRQVGDFFQYSWGLPNKQLFINHFGLSIITIELSSSSTAQNYWYTCFEILATKLNASRAEGMLDYLEEKLDNVIRSCFSATHQKAIKDITLHERHATVLMNEIRSGLDVLTTNLPRFIERKRSRLVPELSLLPWMSVSNISEQSIDWIVDNLDSLTPSTFGSPFDVVIDDRHYDLEKIQTTVLRENTDVYENQVIRGYLENVFLVLVEIERKYGELLASIESYDYLSDISINYQSLIEIRKKFGRKHYEKLLGDCKKLQQQCQRCTYVFDKNLPVKRRVQEEPKMTPGFGGNAHYRNIFDKIVEWYRCGKLSFAGDQFLFSLRTLDKLYEFFCLFQIIEALQTRGLKLEQTNYLQEESNILLRTEWNVEPSNLYIFSGPNNQQVKFYYQHQINRVKSSNGITLVDTYHRGNSDKSHWTPDFIIEMKIDNKSSFSIFDSKYTKPGLAMDHYLPELTMKYIHGIGTQYGGYSQAKALFVLCPRLEVNDFDSYISYHEAKFDIFSTTPSIPALGGITITPSLQSESEIEKVKFTKIMIQILRLLENSIIDHNS